ncbi:MAG: isoprenylcysteine carboxylmethyltransferase family protein [Candidatus Omnitrophica bacterium]|jgi:protein-S-isoprenylcysteine O-methyltransferase Ste14|nr:isoprenylcysteine carboxylmethyltransferase family protein [Candidatus Omnitrophota bacterium]MDD3987598.1 isoprenylcysteine carboxylmethyltransferase family protein [Candidatus Omnitrophota bacterium]MDD4981370.1 isoprenylcysteine carboxylmethyltransferase family protein [Candidatus Omnitrophota bacterium]MDD5664770.1 isoprenylcysteine carboxylmethyltransferase family protein [Candidatus Omnitrophota bacterium]
MPEKSMKKRLKINGIVMFLAVVILAIFPAIFFRRNAVGWDNSIAEIFGIGFILLGQLIRVSARGFKSENSKNGFDLVKTGPYSLVRNPMYLGIILIGFGAVLMLFKWWVVIIFLCFFYIRYILLVYKEEKKLKLSFAEKYADYCKDVPNRIFPSVEALFNRDMLQYLPLKLKWVKKEIGSIIAVLVLILLIESWEDLRYGGIGLFLKELLGLVIVFFLFVLLCVYLIRFINPDNVTDKSKDNIQ